MPGPRAVSASGLLIALTLLAGWSPATADAGPVRMTSPDEEAILYGPTEFLFEVPSRDPEIRSIDIYVGGKLIGTAESPGWSFSWDAPKSAVGDSITATVHDADGFVQRIRIETRDLPFQQQVQSSLVQLFPVVVNRRGTYVSDMGREDFFILDRGQPIEIENFALRPETLSLSMLIDVSASMESKMPQVQNASLRFVEQLDPEESVAVYAFNHSLSPKTPMGLDRDAVEQSILSLQAGGSTALYDALFRVLHDLRETPGRKALFVFSDGKDERSLISLETVVRAAHESSVILFAAGALQPGEDESARGRLDALAEETGGQAFLLRGVEELDDAFDKILAHMRAQYVLSYTPPEGEEGLRQVEVGVHRKGHRVLCRKSYFHTNP